MKVLIIVLVIIVVLALIRLAMGVRIVKQYEEGVLDKNTTVVFPAPLMTTIAELGSFLAGEKAAASAARPALPAAGPTKAPVTTANGTIPGGNGLVTRAPGSSPDQTP
jgi:hypothetical protein